MRLIAIMWSDVEEPRTTRGREQVESFREVELGAARHIAALDEDIWRRLRR